MSEGFFGNIPFKKCNLVLSKVVWEQKKIMQPLATSPGRFMYQKLQCMLSFGAITKRHKQKRRFNVYLLWLVSNS